MVRADRDNCATATIATMLRVRKNACTEWRWKFHEWKWINVCKLRLQKPTSKSKSWLSFCICWLVAAAAAYARCLYAYKYLYHVNHTPIRMLPCVDCAWRATSHSHPIRFPIVFHQWVFSLLSSRDASALIRYYVPVDFRLIHSHFIRISSIHSISLWSCRQRLSWLGLKGSLRSFEQLLGCTICRYLYRPGVEHNVCGFACSKKP